MQLKFTEDILPVTDFRNNAADILAQLAETGRPILLTQRGRASAVLLDVHEYQRMCDRLEALELQVQGYGAVPPPEGTVAPAHEQTARAGERGRFDQDLVRELEKWIEEEG